MLTLSNVHQQFAEFFKSDTIRPFAFLVSKKLADGHICLDLNDMDDELHDITVYDKEAVLKNKHRLGKEHLVSTDSDVLRPFVLHRNKLYLHRYFYYETSILNRLKAFISNEKEYLKERMHVLQQNRVFIQSLFETVPNRESNAAAAAVNWQLVAAITGVLHNFSIITGGPGTGKTTTVAKILAVLYSTNPHLKVALAAPTGKAAARVIESLKGAKIPVAKSIQEKLQTLESATLHRLLKADANSTKVAFNKDNPLDFDVVIVDESSMIDVGLFAKLLDAIACNTRLIMLGDKDQLASVEAGSLFGDLCNAQGNLNLFEKERADFINTFIANNSSKLPSQNLSANSAHPLFQHIVELRYSHRFKGDEGIGKLSKAVINNNQATLIDLLNKNDKDVIIDTQYDDGIFLDFILGYEDYIKEPDIHKALIKLNGVRVLCTTRQGSYGLYETNRRIEFILQQKKWIDKSFEFYEHRPVLITKNYYDLKLFNGDIGIIRKDDAGVLKAWFIDSENNLRSILPGFIASSETVFAMTIHKSQGSEFEKVLVLLPDQADIAILTRELLYTGITRAKKKVCIQGTEEVIMAATGRKVKRASGIKERFIQDAETPKF